jgi:GDP-L-fucose synthase
MNILITGGTGMVGSAFKSLKTDHKLILVGSKDYDLTIRWDCEKMFNDIKPDSVIHLAAKVGGVKGNTDYVADFFSDNIRINTHVLESAKNFDIPKVLSLLSTCIYPDNPAYPLTEDQIHDGEPHESNFGYAYAKRMLEVHSRALRQQYGCKYITAIPNNIYGPNDNFDLENGHVIPAIIRKTFEASREGKVPKFWGDGKPLREFTYSLDIARALIWMIDNYDAPAPLNIGTKKEYSIADVVRTTQEIMGVEVKSTWDDQCPSGQFKKPSSNQKYLELNPEFKYTCLQEGLSRTIEWFLSEYPNVRGV